MAWLPFVLPLTGSADAYAFACASTSASASTSTYAEGSRSAFDCADGWEWEGWMMREEDEDEDEEGRRWVGSSSGERTGRCRSGGGGGVVMTRKRKRKRRRRESGCMGDDDDEAMMMSWRRGVAVVGATTTNATTTTTTTSAAATAAHPTPTYHPNPNPNLNPNVIPDLNLKNLNPKKEKKTRKEKEKSARTSSSSSPSSGLLSCLAGMVASVLPVRVSGRPAPPMGFLYPWIGEEKEEEVYDKRKKKRKTRRDAYRVGSDSRHVPNRFERDEDGKWRRVAEYTLYGSTVANGCSEPKCRTNNAVSNLDGNIQVPSTNNTNSAIGINGPLEINDLPPGWRPLEKSSEARTTLILALSLVLASFICFFVIGCLFWRKTVKRRYKGDVEKARRRRRVVVEEDEEEEEEEREKEKERSWARATARWKANVRQRYRKRRVRSVRSGTTSALRMRGRSGSRASSVSVSRRTSVSSGRSVSPARAPASPPAYHQPQPAPSSDSSLPDASSSDDFGTLHVATDDKGALARLATLASAPAEEGEGSGLGGGGGEGVEGESRVLVSAPEWDEEMEVTEVSPSLFELEALDALDPSSSPLPPPPPPPPPAVHPLFPPPPTKLRQYDYCFSYEEMTMVVEPDPGPSAPPFEAGDEVPSAPPLDIEDDEEGEDGVLAGASAPPLLEDGDGEVGEQVVNVLPGYRP